jgi:PPOX class probable FMN-dependent enzyme
VIFTDVQQLRDFYASPKERAVRKQLTSLDEHCRRFVSLSPFLVMSSCDERGRLDASPRGGEPGFVHVSEAGELLIPDSAGNNRLDSLQNVIQTGQLGLLFMIPGVDETLRVNGSAVVSQDPAHLLPFTMNTQRGPVTVICVTVQEAYLHCAKALMRSNLWAKAAACNTRILPTMNQMIHDQIGDSSLPESQEAMVQRYQKEL